MSNGRSFFFIKILLIVSVRRWSSAGLWTLVEGIVSVADVLLISRVVLIGELMENLTLNKV